MDNGRKRIEEIQEGEDNATVLQLSKVKQERQFAISCMKMVHEDFQILWKLKMAEKYYVKLVFAEHEVGGV
ncbi:hypothetical protein HPP92_018591 [Vanilla planifolia]|uniref:Uncharacterized protein n=1 Tax=Vanilla planifolia TaxID=51239 RepID=A0A835QIE2_VANPL|nr:hypothetical protein HPP92_018591 [Vanilla planifolia]